MTGKPKQPLTLREFFGPGGLHYEAIKSIADDPRGLVDLLNAASQAGVDLGAADKKHELACILAESCVGVREGLRNVLHSREGRIAELELALRRVRNKALRMSPSEPDEASLLDMTKIIADSDPKLPKGARQIEVILRGRALFDPDDVESLGAYLSEAVEKLREQGTGEVVRIETVFVPESEATS